MTELITAQCAGSRSGPEDDLENGGQSVFDIIDEWRAEGLVPDTAGLGSKATTDRRNRPPDAVGLILVRPGTEWWVVSRGTDEVTS